MKQFKIGISAIVLLLAIGTSFAFRNADKKDDLLTCVWYDYTASPGDEHNPANFTLSVSPPPSCPGATNLCAVCVDPSEVYGPAGPFPGLPMVDDENTYIKNIIDNALLQFEDLHIEILNTGAELKN